MTGQSWGTTTARRALWVTALLTLLAGIFGMHGLSSHAGGMGPEMHPMNPAAVVSALGAPAPDVMVAGVLDVADTTMAASASVVQNLPVGEVGATAMCMAVLAVALTMLLRFLGDVPRLGRYRRATTLVRAPMSSGRDPDPPSLIVLSIQRC